MTEENCAATIRALEARRCAAMLAANTGALSELLDESLAYVHSTGARDSRASYLDKLASKLLRYETLELDVATITLSERFALVRGAMKASIATRTGTLAVASLYEAVWMLSAGTWRIIAIQGFVPGAAN
jgi:hypothetical protein